ncbi:TonB-dependent receptor [Pelomonas cellulosilytica]|uniref:TonB-dependent receptor n=1 Tax=Pelomonas cellulosilytica TaxID=2906762 RepID=A0ABS8Y2G3_9BURK|nr:TonB-dependent receptor [Pelomonas sp. P8]MCE4557860.1 TonB-dependent receptor [Pelomonas sp. P8]
MFRDSTPMPLTVLAAACALLAATAQAQTTPEKVETVVVTGQASSLRKALKMQESADNIVSAVVADDIGALPDVNAAESLARLPGVAVQRDQGEGRYVVVRGLGPDMNTITINGSLVPSPEASRRGVSMDVLPSGLIRSLEVIKSLTPDMDANSLGGTVDVKTLSAFDLPKSLLSAGLSGSRDSLSHQTSPAGSLLGATRLLGGTLGVAAALNVDQRKFGSEDVETDGAWSAGKLSGVELRHYRPNRDRAAFAANIDYKPSADSSYYARGIVARFSDDEERDRLTLSNITGGSVAEGAPATVRAERRLRARKYTRSIRSLVLGTEQEWGDWTLQANVGLGQGTERTPEQLNDARFRQNNVAGVSFTDTTKPLVTGPAALYDASKYTLNSFTLQKRASDDNEHNGRVDLTRAFTLDGGTKLDLKFGAKLSRRDKKNDTDQWSYSSGSATSGNYWGAGPTALSAFVTGSTLDFSMGDIGPAMDSGAIRARLAALPRDAAKVAGASALSDYELHENIDAAYVQASVDLSPAWSVLAGVRHERTRFDAAGFASSVAGVITPTQYAKDYGNWLPGLHTRYKLDKETSVRAAWTNSVVRPNFDQLSPAVTLSSTTEASIGNPLLSPMRAHNLDLGIERLLGSDGAVSAYVFHKDIKDFTYATNLAGTGDWASYTSVTGYANGSKARVDGVELSWQQQLRMLPGWMSGFLVGANASFTHSSADVGRYDTTSKAQLVRSSRMPGQSDTTVNLMLGYEAGPLSTRLAVNHKSKYLLQFGSDVTNAALDQVVASQRQVDLSVAYKLTPSVQLTFEGVNLNNEHYYTYVGVPQLNYQYEQYGRTYKLGLKVALF